MDRSDDAAIEESTAGTACGLALYLPPAVEDRLRRDLAERGLPCPTRFHLTLKYSFLPKTNLDREWERLERLIAGCPPLRLQSSGLLASADTYCHLLLIQPLPELMQLHEHVMDLLGDCGPLVSPETARFEGTGYTPHITVGYGACSSDFEMHQAMLAEYEPAVHFLARSVERVDRALAGGEEGWSRAITKSFRFAPF